MSSLSTSPFTSSSKIDSYFVPDARETSDIRALLVNSAVELATLDKQLKELESALVDLRARREALHRDIVAHESLLSPIRRLSPDILSEIFLACLPRTHNPIIHPSHAPLLFGRVCRYWRELSRSTPMLWKKIHIRGLHDSAFVVFDRNPDQDGPGPAGSFYPAFGHHAGFGLSPRTHTAFLNTVNRFIEYAAASPLSIFYVQHHTVDANGSPTEADRDAILQVFDCVLAARSRIEALAIHAQSAELRRLSELSEGEMPLLKRLTISVQDGHPEQPLLENLTILRGAHLEELCFSGRGSPLKAPVPWIHLRKLSLVCYRTAHRNVPPFFASDDDGLDQNAMHEILGYCPLWVQAEFGIVRWEPWKPGSVVMMAHLEHLIISLGHGRSPGDEDSTPNIGGLLGTLSMPKLSIFQLSSFFYDILSDNLDRVANSAHMSFPAPGELAVHLHPELEFSAEFLLAVLAELPRTTALYLSPHAFTTQHGQWVPPFNAGLFPGLQERDLCPGLQSLHVTFPSIHQPMRPTGLLQFVRSRRADGSPLNSLHLDLGHSRAEDLDIEEDLRVLEREGLSLRIDEERRERVPRWRYNIPQLLRIGP
uniref:F-box domain-containing protein n=1 Tax=Mycena chlorophos TaxID=658473 RepID=A0ABQ0L7M5_MYCCL|nr:predicted protein [Mycena chlorophos]